MAYSDSVGDNAELLRRTVFGVADFSGRSRRTEVVYYWIASALLAIVVDFAIGSFATFQVSVLFSGALRLLLSVPMFALFVRRLHDQERSGWWGLLLPASLLLSISGFLVAASGDIARIVAQRTSFQGIAAGLCGLGVFVLCLLPGTDGPNRYGADPRIGEV